MSGERLPLALTMSESESVSCTPLVSTTMKTKDLKICVHMLHHLCRLTKQLAHSFRGILKNLKEAKIFAQSGYNRKINVASFS